MRSLYKLRIDSFRSVLWSVLAVAAIMCVAYWAFEHRLYTPAVIARSTVMVADGRNRVTAPTRQVQVGKHAFWQVEISGGDWRDCGGDCEAIVRRALAK
jgi:hypothetical protein